MVLKAAVRWKAKSHLADRVTPFPPPAKQAWSPGQGGAQAATPDADADAGGGARAPGTLVVSVGKPMGMTLSGDEATGITITHIKPGQFPIGLD